MKIKVIVLYFTVLVFGCCCLSAQQQEMSYYYKGHPITLPINNRLFLLYADAKKISNEQFSKEYKITEWIEDGSDGIIEAQVDIPSGNYDSVTTKRNTFHNAQFTGKCIFAS